MDTTTVTGANLSDAQGDSTQNVESAEQQAIDPQSTPIIQDDSLKIDIEDKPQIIEPHQAASKLEITLQPIDDVIEELLINNPNEAISEPILDNPPETSQDMYINDNGIFDFMTPDRAIELFKRIHSEGIPSLDWKFYGRRKPGEQERDESKDTNGNNDESQNRDNPLDQTLNNTEFDFDVDEFSDLQSDNTLINESLSLKKRPEPSKEKKTNLSDIMSDIMKESHAEDDEV